ncbi:MAG: prolyl oligopeptidase family serine peptidase [Opitutus sp.]|nr:prolyl oligopeptidase family serine peptidase [Opitutus sp.]
MRKLLLLAGSVWAVTCMAADRNYPEARRSDHVDTYHGEQVADPYRWLEDIDSPETKTWVAAQRKLTDEALAAIPEREAIRAELQRLWNYPRQGLPVKRGGRYFFKKNDGLQNQSVLYVQDTLESPARALVDPNTLAEDGTVAVGVFAASPDGRWLAYALQTAGSDWQDVLVRDIATGQDTDDVVRWVKFSNLRWTKDSRGFFYGRYPELKKGDKLFGKLVNRQIYYHRIGTPQSEDTLVYELPEHPEWHIGFELSDDGRFVVFDVERNGETQNALYVLDLVDADAPKFGGRVEPLCADFDANYAPIGSAGDVFYLLTNKDAPRKKIIAVDRKNPAPSAWRTLVAESQDNIDEVTFVGRRFVVSAMRDVKSRLTVYAEDGTPQGEIALPGIGTVAGVSGRDDETEMFYDFSSFLTPPTVFRYDVATQKGGVFLETKVDFNAADYETQQVWVTSRDGTRFPMFVTHRKGLKLDGSAPAWLYGYGGFNISLQPQFAIPPLVWLRMGGVYAVATLRGGGEYGEAWHLAGTKERKQNVFDDYIAAADWLVDKNYTARDRLVLQGRSNGGLLVGAVINQRPDLGAVAFPQVGVLDMLRFHTFTIGAGWVSDYGSSETPEGFRYLRAYSPLHNIRSGADYPAVLATTGDHDDRVYPAHTYKYTAALQAAVAGGRRPALVRIEANAGHGGSSGTTPVSKTIDEWTDMFGFAVKNIAPGAAHVPAEWTTKANEKTNQTSMNTFNYPPARKDGTIDDYHGQKVPDPYRWLEDLDSAETAAWVGAQNQLTFGFLEKLPQREWFKKRLTKLWNYPKFGLPQKEAGKYFFSKNEGLQNQAVLYVQDSLHGEPRVLLDPNQLSEDGTVALTATAVSDDGKWLAYGTASAGSDWNEYRVRGIADAQDTDDVVKWVKFSSLSWTKDSKGFFYSRFPEPKVEAGTGKTFSALEHQKLYYHRLGTPQSEDLLIAEVPDQPKWFVYGGVTDEGRFLIVHLARGDSNDNLIRFADLGDPKAPRLDAPFVNLVDEWEAEFSVIGNLGSTLFLQTNLDAPRKRIIAVDTRNPARDQWRTVVPEGQDVIEWAAVIGGKIVVLSMRDVAIRLSVYRPDGTAEGDVPLPGLGQIAGVSGRADDPEIFYSFTSFTYPTTIFRHDLKSGKGEVFRAPTVDFDPAAYETKQVFYSSKDGTRVPMFITHKKGLALDGTAPALLYGYGGFDVSLQPAFSLGNLVWMEAGGVYAVPNLRGGGEYGKEWHEAGTKERKQNVFDDFIAAAEWLIENRYTSSAKLVLSGGSNGGLLVGATVNQRPELARVALPAVGVMDMLRFHKFTIGHAWVADYGSSDDPEGFKYLRAYSPLHTVKTGARYPAVLVTTADHDDRVHPAHSFKYTAAMQEAARGRTDTGPVLIRIETKAGHGAGKPTSKIIEEAADKLAFAAYFVGLKPQ